MIIEFEMEGFNYNIYHILDLINSIPLWLFDISGFSFHCINPFITIPYAIPFLTAPIAAARNSFSTLKLNYPDSEKGKIDRRTINPVYLNL